MEKKTTAKLDGTKTVEKPAAAKETAETKAAPAGAVKSVVKEAAEETKKAVTETKKAVETKAAEVTKAVETKAAAEVTKAVQETKAATEKAKEAVKEKKVAKVGRKPVRKEKTELKPEVFIQFQGQEAIVEEAIEKAKNQFVAEGHRLSSIKTLQMYLKPEESAAYYVINEKFAGRVDLF